VALECGALAHDRHTSGKEGRLKCLRRQALCCVAADGLALAALRCALANEEARGLIGRGRRVGIVRWLCQWSARCACALRRHAGPGPASRRPSR
jgi:hypothetical protein